MRRPTIWIDEERDARPAEDRPAYYVSSAPPIVDRAQHDRWNFWFCLVLAACIGAVACSIARGAELPQPAPEVLSAAADHAAAAWGSQVHVEIRFADLGTCAYRKRSTFATTEVIASHSFLAFDDGRREDGPTTYSYAIKLNSSCNWIHPDPRFTLDAVMLHEMGHVIISAAYHSTDRRSIMYHDIEPGQTIRDADRALVASVAELRPSGD